MSKWFESWFEKRRYWVMFLPFLLFNFVVWAFIIRPRAKRKGWIDCIFVVYPGASQDITAYVPLWFQRLFTKISPFSIPVIGVITSGKSGVRGVVITLSQGPDEFSVDQWGTLLTSIQSLAEEIGAKSIALAGRIPGVLLAARIPINPPFVVGDKGTVYTIVAGATRLFLERQLPPDHPFSVIGIGQIGSIVHRRLGVREGYRVIGVDPKVQRTLQYGRLTLTSDPMFLLQSKVWILLTEKGSDIENIISALREVPGRLEEVALLDDTHPRISRKIKNQLEQGGIRVYWAALEQQGVRFFPKLPNRDAKEIPGCYIEAQGVAKGLRFESQNGFDEWVEKESGLQLRF